MTILYFFLTFVLGIAVGAFVMYMNDRLIATIACDPIDGPQDVDPGRTP